jgi:hypothetical protein
MDFIVLRNEVLNDPLGKGYGALLPSCPGVVVEMLNAYTEITVKSRMITARAVLTDCGPLAGSILDKLESAASANSAVKWAVKFIAQDAGIDIGSTAAQGMVDQLAAGGVFTSAEAMALKGMAIQPASRAEQLGLGSITEQDLRTAMEAT